MSQERSTGKRWLFRAAKLLIVVVLVWAIRRTLSDAWNQLGEYSWQFLPWWLVLSAGLYLLGLLLAGFFWYRVLRTLGQNAKFGETIRAYFVGHLGKYVPGKAMVVIIRTAMIRGHRIDTSVAAVSVFLETLTMMAVGAFLAAAFLAAALQDRGPAFWGAIALTVLAGLPTLPPVFKRLVRLAGVGKSDPEIAQKIDKLGYRTLLEGWAIMIPSWGLLGLSYWATLRAMGIEGLDPLLELPRYTASVALATVAGFLLLVLPGGVGVREAFLAELMIPYLEELVSQAAVAALASAALLRLVWLMSELVISGILYPMYKRKPTP